MSQYPPSRRYRRKNGFTLLEVLTATVMFAIIMGAVYSVFSAALRLRETAYQAFEKSLPRDYIAGIIRDDLANIMLPTGVLAGPMTGQRDEKGSLRMDSLEIHTDSGSIGNQYPWGDIQRIKYSLEEVDGSGNRRASASSEPGGKDLVRTVTRNLLATVEDNPETEYLLSGVQSLTIGYYYNEGWLDSWDSATRQEDSTDSTPLPLAIKFRVDFVPPQSGEREMLPLELVVPIVKAAVTPKTQQQQTSSQPSQTSNRTSTSGGGK